MTEAVAESEGLVLRFNEAQGAAWMAEEPFVGLCFGIRGGKTYFGRNWIVDRAVRFPRSLHMATANSYPQLELVTIPNLIEALDQWGVDWRHMSSKRRFEISTPRGVSRIEYRSTEKVHHLRGAELGSVWMDEVRDAKRGALDVMKGRLSCPHVDKPRMLCTTTPNGFDAFYAEFVGEGRPGTHAFFKSTTRDNPHLRPDYIQRIYDDYDPDMAAQELDADFRVMGVGKVYSSYAREVNGRGNDYDASLPLWLCVDFNIGSMGWALVQITGSGEVHAVAEVFARDCTIPRMAKLLAEGGNTGRAEYPAWAKLHKGPWNLDGDATDGRNRETGASDWKVLTDALRAHGIVPTVHKLRTNPAVKDRVNSVNALLRSATGRHRLFHHPRCTELQKDFEQLVWKNGDIDKARDPMRSHLSDAVGYLVHNKFPVTGSPLLQGRFTTAQ